jgi:hypothetical protein
VTGYKINLQKSLAFLYTNNEQIEKDGNNGTIVNNFIYNSLKKKVKYLEANLAKDVSDLYKENYIPEERD